MLSTSNNVGIRPKNSKIAFCATLWGDLGATYTVHLWLVGKRVVDFLLVLIELFCQLSRLRCYEQILIEIVLLEWGWVTLSANFRGKGGSFTNEFWRQKVRFSGYHVVLLA